MTDQQVWSAAVERVTVEYTALPAAIREQLKDIAAEIMVLKKRHQSAVTSADADRICAECRGVCCRFGKHHFTVVELLVFLAAGRELFAPAFAHPVCPYLDGCSCYMEPSLRPFNCIIFICEQLEERLSGEARDELAGIERRLRQLYRAVDGLLGNRFANGLLITYQRTVETGTPLFTI